jgi:hypothetical protein
MEISKLEAAKRQLDCAIRLFFNDDDMSSIITLSRAAFRLLWDIYPSIANDGFEKPLGRVIEILGWSRFNEVANFLKHADKDPEAQMEPHHVSAQLGIGLAVILYGRATDGTFSPEMKAWETYMTLAQPDIWDSHPDPQAEGYEDFRKALEEFRNGSREQRLAMGRFYLHGFKRMEQGYRPV